MNTPEASETLVRLDLGSGPNVKEGFIGVDSRDFGQQIVADLREPWKWADSSVDEVYCSHFVEHLTATERVHFVNELYRVLKPGARAEIITPHWASSRAYGDLTHQWPPVSPHWYLYLQRSWREQHAPHNDMYVCDFTASWGFRLDGYVVLRNQEFQQFCAQYYVNAAEDLIATLEKKVEDTR